MLDAIVVCVDLNLDRLSTWNIFSSRALVETDQVRFNFESFDSFDSFDSRYSIALRFRVVVDMRLVAYVFRSTSK